MFRILIAELKQETATFNPAPTRYEDFHRLSGSEMISAFAQTKTELAGAMDVFQQEGGVEIVPTMAASAVSGGPIVSDDLNRLLQEIIESVRVNRNVDGAYLCLHGAMAGEDEVDPEGRLLTEVRSLLGDAPLVASLDLHAILTDRMLAAADILVPYHTYPHVDHYETGGRAAVNLLRLLRQEVQPTTARVKLPMLVRGDELLTATGKFGEAIRMCQEIENSSSGLAAGVIIGNAFTDVPDLRTNVIITTDGNAEQAEEKANAIARFMWRHRERFQAALTPLEEAIAIAEKTKGLTVFSDAADATASGASGDSNEILKGLLEQGFSGSALLQIVDPAAVGVALDIGVGGRATFTLGGSRDPGRFQPVTVDACVKSLHDGHFRYEDETEGRAGRVAVLKAGRICILVSEQSVYVVGRRVFQAHGLEPQSFDLVVVKSPNGFRTWYEAIAARIVAVDVPGSTSANLKSLPFEHCPRPMFPLDKNATPPFPPELSP